MGSDPQYAKWPLLPLAQHVFTLTNPYAARPAQQASTKALQDAINEHKMAHLYRFLAHPIEGILNPTGEGTAASSQKPSSRKLSTVGMTATGSSKSAGLPWDEEVYKKLKAENDQELEEFQKEEDEAVEKAGDTEVTAARGKRAEFYARVGDKVRRTDPQAGLLREFVMLTHDIGQGDSGIRRLIRKDRHPGYQDRPRTCDCSNWSLLWRQVISQETSCACKDIS